MFGKNKWKNPENRQNSIRLIQFLQNCQEHDVFPESPIRIDGNRLIAYGDLWPVDMSLLRGDGVSLQEYKCDPSLAFDSKAYQEILGIMQNLDKQKINIPNIPMAESFPKTLRQKVDSLFDYVQFHPFSEHLKENKDKIISLASDLPGIQDSSKNFYARAPFSYSSGIEGFVYNANFVFGYPHSPVQCIELVGSGFRLSREKWNSFSSGCKEAEARYSVEGGLEVVRLRSASGEGFYLSSTPGQTTIRGNNGALIFRDSDDFYVSMAKIEEIAKWIEGNKLEAKE